MYRPKGISPGRRRAGPLERTFSTFRLPRNREQRHGVPEEEYPGQLSRSRDLLFASRKTRVPPLKDDKVLTDWNGLVISALSLAARVFGEERYLKCCG